MELRQIWRRFAQWLRNPIDTVRSPPLKHIDWFNVTFDDDRVTIHASPPGRENWAAEFPWSTIVGVCFKAEDFLLSDGIYIFTTERPESYVIPTEAIGGSELWGEILRRGLFDAELAITAACSSEGLFCWPQEMTYLQVRAS